MRPTQKSEVIGYIRRFGSITPMEAFYDLGITKLATRISDLRADGWTFKIERIEHKTRLGKTTFYCRYSCACKGAGNENI